MGRLNTRLSHLSYERPRTQRDWNVGGLTGAMAELVWRFFCDLSDERRGWFEAAKNAAFWGDGLVVRWGSADQSVMTTTVSVKDGVVFSCPGPGGRERDHS